MTKVKLEMEFDIPEDGFTQPELDRLLFDQFINFSVCQHLREALDWQAKFSTEGDNEWNGDQAIVCLHQNWSEIIRKAEWTVKITEESS